MARVIRWLGIAVLLLSGSACSAIYGDQPGREERAVAQVSERGFKQVGEHAVVDDRYVHVRVLFGDEAQPCAGMLIIDMDYARYSTGPSTTVIKPETFLKPDGTPYRPIPKQVQDPVIDKMNDDPELDSCFGQN